MLAITASLKTRGGFPINPEINMEVALQPRMIQFSLAPAYQPDPTPEQRNRRTHLRLPCPRHGRSLSRTVQPTEPERLLRIPRRRRRVAPGFHPPQQRRHHRPFHRLRPARREGQHQSASRADQAAPSTRAGTPADEAELTQLTAYRRWRCVDTTRASLRKRREYPTQITRSLVEEFSGQIFEYEEILPVFDDYQPDLKAADVDARQTRALADVCLLLFNTNEFSYVYYHANQPTLKPQSVMNHHLCSRPVSQRPDPPRVSLRPRRQPRWRRHDRPVGRTRPGPARRPALRPRSRCSPAPKAKNVIMLFMEGGPGHMDTFDPKPKLPKLHKTGVQIAGADSPTASSSMSAALSKFPQSRRAWHRDVRPVDPHGRSRKWLTNCATTAVARPNRSTIPKHSST